MSAINNTLTALKGVKVGQSTYLDKLTGCTAVMFDKPYSVAYKGYGGGIGSFNTEGLKSGSTDYKENGLFISGGSAAGLISGGELLQCLRDDKKGSVFAGGKVYNPSVAGAIVFDQGMHIAPFEAEYAQKAYENLSSEPVESGNVGAGTGSSVGKFRWIEGGKKSGAMKAGTGSARVDVGPITVCALSVVNALGNIVLPDGSILAGNREDGGGFKQYKNLMEFVTEDKANTTVTIVGINVDMRAKEYLERVAHIATHGHVRAIHPVHTSLDGDSMFVFSTGEIKTPFNEMAKYFTDVAVDEHFLVDIVGNAAAEAVQQSIYDACRSAKSIQLQSASNGIIPSASDYSE